MSFRDLLFNWDVFSMMVSNQNKQVMIGWIIGFYVVMFPIALIYPRPVITSLIHSIIGVACAVSIMLWRFR